MTKYDFLVTEVQDKLVETIHLLQEHGEIEPELSLKEVYNKYFHPAVLPINDQKYWNVLHDNSVLNIFQFDSDVGSQAAKKIKPNSIFEMADANGLMRLMTSEKGEETPMEKYIRFKNNINLWYREMNEYGLTKEEQKIVEPYFKQSYGVPPSQEQLMKMLMDEKICGFTLAEANAARKIVGKKQMSKIPELRDKVLKQAKSPCLGNYIWKCGVAPQLGYSFSVIHALAYSFIGFQTIYIATRWNPIYWNTACLIINSASLESEEDDNEDATDKKDKTTDYGKLAKAIGDIRSRGIKISLVDINKSSYSFEPDPENNEILFGMKGVNKVGGPIIDAIIAGRPYSGIVDFMRRCPLNKTVMVSLIKAGAFDKIDEHWAKEICAEPRFAIMAFYILSVYGGKTKLNLQNFSTLMQKGLVPDELDLQKRVFAFNKYLKEKKVDKYYLLDDNCLTFYNNYFSEENLSVINGHTCILQSAWDKIYKKVMDNARNWLKDNQNEVLNQLNTMLFMESWNKYASGNISDWEMESLCFYYHKHVLASIDTVKYGLSNFFELPTTPVIETTFKRNGKDIPIYKTYKIVGTVIGKNDTRSSISLLTLDGVVNVKFTKEYFAMYNRQLSEVQPDGSKKVVEKSWFTRGTKIMVTGFRRDDMFQTKTYKHTKTHQLYQIVAIHDGDIELEHERYSIN